MRDFIRGLIIQMLKSECDAAAQDDDAARLERLHAFIQQTATNYVRLRLSAIESRQAGRGTGTGDGAREAADMERLAEDIVAGVYARG